MKRIVLILAVLLLFAASTSAQDQIKPAIYVGGGLGMPMGPDGFKDYWGMGMGFGGGVGLGFTPYLEVIGKFYFNQFPFDGDKLLSDAGVTGVTIDGFDFRALEFGADVKYIFGADGGAPFKPYGIVGLGMANIKFTDITVTGDGDTLVLPLGGASATKFMLNGGVGFDYMFSPKMGLWVDARYATILTEGDAFSYFPIRGGLKVMLGE